MVEGVRDCAARRVVYAHKARDFRPRRRATPGVDVCDTRRQREIAVSIGHPSTTSSAACLGQVYAHKAGDCRATHGLTRAVGDADTRRHRAIAASDRPSRRDIMGRLIRARCRLRPFIAGHRCVGFMRINAAGPTECHPEACPFTEATQGRAFASKLADRSGRSQMPGTLLAESSLRPLRSLCAQTPRLADSPIRPGKGRAPAISQ